MIVLLLAAMSVASAQQPPVQPAEPVVVASGQGVVFAVPDRAWITISAESRAPSPREAQRLNAEAMKPVQDKLRAAGVPADAIRTIAYDVQFTEPTGDSDAACAFPLPWITWTSTADPTDATRAFVVGSTGQSTAQVPDAEVSMVISGPMVTPVSSMILGTEATL